MLRAIIWAPPGPRYMDGADKGMSVASESAKDAIVDIRNVHFSRGTRPIFAGLNVSVRRGKVTAIMGPSGTGKTTMLRMITRQLVPSSGAVIVDGQDIGELNNRDMYALRRRMGMLFQNGALLTDYSVFENVAFPLREHTKLPGELIRHIVLTKLHAVGLRGAADLMPSELSGGMARRVALARAIVMDPDLLLYDEPFAGLDPISMGVVMRLIRVTNDVLGLTSIVVSHDVHEISNVADYCYVISEGRVVGEGKPKALLDSQSELVRQFMRGDADGPVPFHYPAPDYRSQLFEEG